MATKEELTTGIQVLMTEANRIGGRLSDVQWAAAGDEGGWTNKQILAHVAGVGGMVVPFVTSLASAAPGADAGAGFDIDALNAQIVGQRADKSVPQLVEEITTNYSGVVDWLRGAPQDTLDGKTSFLMYKDMTVSDLMMQIVVMHGISHLYHAAS